MSLLENFLNYIKRFFFFMVIPTKNQNHIRSKFEKKQDNKKKKT